MELGEVETQGPLGRRETALATTTNAASESWELEQVPRQAWRQRHELCDGAGCDCISSVY